MERAREIERERSELRVCVHAAVLKATAVTEKSLEAEREKVFHSVATQCYYCRDEAAQGSS